MSRVFFTVFFNLTGYKDLKMLQIKKTHYNLKADNLMILLMLEQKEGSGLRKGLDWDQFLQLLIIQNFS